jgi:hypothetical protein
VHTPNGSRTFEIRRLTTLHDELKAKAAEGGEPDEQG